ncbi:helix-turn-helix domain-containing protein [Pediococcus siamensis]|uniref:helix-turn-helix domain-containing protein n=1 Tax=Pediococcus siamensis TaxID=381829 RepID=UPI0039A0343A
MIKLAGNFIRMKRQEIGLTIEELAEKADVSASYLARLERGQLDDTSTKKLEAILTALDLDLTDILISNEFNDVYTPEVVARLRKMDTEKRVQVAKAILELLK